ncbi:unnamed protein product [Adineta steineri]|uniref:G-protein coupled receptors family 1 profile domain-containing protein n=1 Tax=Adineta steineri TaxID=433720 RepID=A0A815GFP6_9BILA|nr:unnamed protein product [Adineta steineri]CAF3963090.1 unnamed protein product [Adineta steineri]
MSAPVDTTYVVISQYIAIYAGIPMFALGVVGGIFNIIVFLSLQTFRQSSCAIFLTVMSFVNVGQLVTGLLSRIMISGFNVDWTETSSFYCKFRNYCLQFCALTSYTCVCLAVIDQYMATSFYTRWQQYFNTKKAFIACGIACIIWLIHGIPSLISFNLSFNIRTRRNSCILTNPNFQPYYSYGYILILAGILPIIIDIAFGSLAYRNVRQIPYRTVPLVRRELDKQLTSMVLIQVVYKTLVVLPYVTILFILLTANINALSITVLQLNFLNFVTGMIYYLNFASPFYIYMCVSKRFRQQFIYVILSIYSSKRKQQCIGINQIKPLEEQSQQL